MPPKPKPTNQSQCLSTTPDGVSRLPTAVLGLACTSQYGRGVRPWRAITAPELKIWLGLVIYMSVVSATTIFDYWSRNTELPAHQISAFMSRTRFQQIKRYLHLSPPGIVPIQRWWTKLEPMSSQLKANFKRYVKPRSVVSIDEIMVRFTGRSLHTVAFRGKPVPLGYKILALCDAGYVYGFRRSDSPKAPFEGNVPICNEAFDRFDWQTLVPDVQLAIRNLSATSRAVLRLCLQLPKDPSFVVWIITSTISRHTGFSDSLASRPAVLRGAIAQGGRRSYCFVESVFELPATDLVSHRVPTYAQARPTVAKLPLFTKEEVDFQRSKSPELIDAGIFASVQSPWCARTKFPRKSNGKLRIVHSYCPINDATIKDSYPMQRIEPIRNRLSQKKNKVFFQADASNGQGRHNGSKDGSLPSGDSQRCGQGRGPCHRLAGHQSRTALDDCA